MRYLLTINRDTLDKTKPSDDPKHQARPILVKDTQSGQTREERDVWLPGLARVVYGDPQQDGARVWIETDAVIYRA